MKCPNCLKDIADGSDVCPECGSKIKSDNVSDTNSNNVSNNDIFMHNQETLKKQNMIIILLLTVITIGIVYLGIMHSNSKETSQVEYTKDIQQVLCVDMEDRDGFEVSDYSQIDDALRYGGQIIVNLNQLDATLQLDTEMYAAVNSEGRYYTEGALLNYIASRGWTLVQHESFGDMYYFIKSGPSKYNSY